MFVDHVCKMNQNEHKLLCNKNINSSVIEIGAKISLERHHLSILVTKIAYNLPLNLNFNRYVFRTNNLNSNPYNCC